MRLACYCRYSSNMQREESIEGQLDIINDWADKNSHSIVMNYIDKAMSGKTDNRPDFLKMIEDAKRNLWDGIVVHKIDRFGRDDYDIIYYRRKLKESGKKFFSIAENITDNAASTLTSAIFGGLAKFYIENLAVEVQKGKNVNAKNCKFNGGRPPLGYDINKDKKYIINESEARIIKIIFEMYLNGSGLLSIAYYLNENGYKSKLGRAFTKNSLFDVIGNEKYTGTYIYNKNYTSKKRNQDRDDEIRIENAIPKIISKEDFKKVMEKRKLNKHRVGQFSSKENYLLTGIIKCGYCNSAYIGAKRKKKNNSKEYVNKVYVCSKKNKVGQCESKSIKCDYIEGAVFDILKDEIRRTYNLDKYIEDISIKFDNIHNNSAIYIENTQIDLTNITNRINNLVGILSNGIKSDAILSELTSLENSKKILEDKLSSLESIKNTNKLNKGFILKTIDKDLFGIEITNIDNVKKIFHKYVEKIEVYNDFIDIYFNFNFDGVNSTPCLAGMERNLMRWRIIKE